MSILSLKCISKMIIIFLKYATIRINRTEPVSSNRFALLHSIAILIINRLEFEFTSLVFIRNEIEAFILHMSFFPPIFSDLIDIVFC